MLRVVEQIGRAGGPGRRAKVQAEWNQRYGEGTWQVVYQYEGRIYTREEALREFYDRSYLEYLVAHSDTAHRLCKRARVLYNPHADATGGVDLQVPAVMKALATMGLKLRGTEKVAIGVFGTKQGAVFPPISHELNPYNIPLWCDASLNVEGFWQDFKYLAINT